MTNPYLLKEGSHRTPKEGRCAMEWVAHLAGEPHTDTPECVSPVLRDFCVVFNDRVSGERRQRLRPYLARMIGTADDGFDEQRRWLCVDWLLREFMPAFLELAPRHRKDADALRALPAIKSKSDAEHARRILVSVCERSIAGWPRWSCNKTPCWEALNTAGRAFLPVFGVWAAAKIAVEVASRDVEFMNAVPSLVEIGLQDRILASGGLLDRMLPTEVVRVPVVSEWREICCA